MHQYPSNLGELIREQAFTGECCSFSTRARTQHERHPLQGFEGNGNLTVVHGDF